MTNVSLTINNFKLLALSDAVRDFFEVTFTPPGQISAGLATEIMIRFIPKINEDIVSELPLLAATGPLAVPIECTTKKVACVGRRGSRVC
jgi:hypothetical protein